MTTSQIMSELTLPQALVDGDPRRDAPAFHRNGSPIVDALTPRLGKADGDVLEIGSGSGQHVALLARSFPQLTYWPSDPDPAHRASIDAWRAHLGIETIRPAIDLDASAQEWAMAETPEHGFRAIFCANVIHIAPWSVAEGLFRGAAQSLAPGGFLALYGPFRWHGRHNSEGNEAFDASLRARNPAWGVRDIDEVDHLATSHDLMRVQTATMPANNHLLFFAHATRRA